MRFDIDVLIVFADADNETGSNEPGWVSQFKKFLELMLVQVLGEKPNIILKSESDTITSPRLDNAAVLITILSKNFIQSGRCLDYLESFYKATEGDHSKITRLFKVFKSPLTVQEQPPRLRELIGYEMYQIDPDSGEMLEYKDYFSSEAERQYWMKMVDLTYDTFDSLLSVRNDGRKGDLIQYKRKTIYLAETGHDLSVQRNIIKRELQRHGYNVLPNQTLPGVVNELERIIKRDLEQSNISIHLIGSAYGEIPEGSDRSVVDHQLKLSAERSIASRERQVEFPRLIWIPANLSNASERQKAFIESIKRDVEAQEGVEILQTSLEDFKNIMREELMEAVEKTVTAESHGKTVYLMHDRVDTAEVRPFIQLIRESGFEVITPKFEGELLELRQNHIDNLRRLDAAVIYKGKVNEQWVRMKALDLLKAPGFGRKKPIIAKAIVTPPHSGMNVDTYRSQNVRVIEGDQRYSMELLKNFLQEFNS